MKFLTKICRFIAKEQKVNIPNFCTDSKQFIKTYSVLFVSFIGVLLYFNGSVYK